MRLLPTIVPKGRLQILISVCQVSASCHSRAIAPNSIADAPKIIRPYNAVFTKSQRPRRAGCDYQERTMSAWPGFLQPCHMRAFVALASMYDDPPPPPPPLLL